LNRLARVVAITAKLGCQLRKIHHFGRAMRAIQAVTPSVVFTCPGQQPIWRGDQNSLGLKNKWFPPTDRIVAVGRVFFVVGVPATRCPRSRAIGVRGFTVAAWSAHQTNILWETTWGPEHNSRNRGNDQRYVWVPNASKETGEVLRRRDKVQQPSNILHRLPAGKTTLSFLCKTRPANRQTLGMPGPTQEILRVMRCSWRSTFTRAEMRSN